MLLTHRPAALGEADVSRLRGEGWSDAAIHDAIGIWIHDLPATSERVLAALTNGPTPGAPGVSTALAPETDRANLGEPAAGVDPAPDAPTDPQPLRAPQDDGGDWERRR